MLLLAHLWMQIDDHPAVAPDAAMTMASTQEADTAASPETGAFDPMAAPMIAMCLAIVTKLGLFFCFSTRRQRHDRTANHAPDEQIRLLLITRELRPPPLRSLLSRQVALLR